MKRIKPYFITSLSMFTFALTFYAIYRLKTHGLNQVDVGLLLTSLPFTLFLANILGLKKTARTQPNMPLVSVPTLIGFLFITQAFILGTSKEANILVLGGIMSLGYFLYITWYSKLNKVHADSLGIGKPLPTFTLTNGAGESFSTDELKGQPSIILFFRGNWCPLCVAQIKELAKDYQEIAKRGARVILVSPQSQSHSQQLAKSVNAPMEFMTDSDHLASRTLGIEVKNGIPMGMGMLGYDSESVLPTVLITDANGILVWLHQTDNYRVRPEPATFLEVLDKMANNEEINQPNQFTAYWNDQIIARSNDTVVVEGNHYFPETAINSAYFKESTTTSLCPWKGTAHYYHIEVDGNVNQDSAWYYPSPSPMASKIKDRVAFWKGVRVVKE